MESDDSACRAKERRLPPLNSELFEETLPSHLLAPYLLSPMGQDDDCPAGVDFQEKVLQMLQELTEGQRRLERQLRSGQPHRAVARSSLRTKHARIQDSGLHVQPEPSSRSALDQKSVDPQLSTATFLSPTSKRLEAVESHADNHQEQAATRQITFQGGQNSLANVRGVLVQIKSLAPRLASQRILLLGDTGSMIGDILASYNDDSESSGSRCIIHPDSPFRAPWDLIGALLLLYDSIQIPFVVAWGVAPHGFLRSMSLISFVYWALDLILGFFFGYHTVLGEVVMHRHSVAVHFLKGNFLPNLIAVVLDALGILVDNMVVNDEGWAGNTFLVLLLRFVRVPRILRLMLVLRSGRLADLYTAACRWLDIHNLGHQSFSVFITILKLVFAILWATHLLACLWHVIGSDATRTYYQNLKNSVVDESLLEDIKNDTWLGYLNALYWSTNILIAAAGIHPPLNAAELCVTIIAMLIGFMGSSTVIGIISDTLMASRTTSAERLERIDLLRKYLAQSHVPPTFAVCVEKQATQLYTTNRILEEDVELLKNLSQSMRELLSSLVWSPAVCTQQFIRQCQMVSKYFIHNMCSLALDKTVLPPGAYLLDHDASAPGAFFVNWGRLEYLRPNVQDPSERPAPDDVRSRLLSSGIQVKTSMKHVAVTRSCQDVQSCSWIYEIALFCTWDSCGALCAASVCEALTLKGDVFISICAQDAIIKSVAQDYAVSLCRAISHHPELMTSELNLPIAHEEVLPLLNVESRKVLSFAGWDLLKRHQLVLGQKWSQGIQTSLVNHLHLKVAMEAADGTARGAPKSLVSEIDSGACDLVVQSSMQSWDARPEEAVLRVVSLVALKLERSDGKVCLQLGRLVQEDGHLRVDSDIKLPGAKVLAGELPSDTMSRLIREKLSGLWGRMTVTSKASDVSEKLSEAYRVKTSYVRHVMVSFFDDVDDDWQTECGARAVHWRLERHGGEHHALDQVVRWSTYRASDKTHSPGIHEAFVLDPRVENSPPVFAWVAPGFVEDDSFAEELKAWMNSRTLGIA